MGKLEVVVYSAQSLTVESEFGTSVQMHSHVVGFYDPFCTVMCDGQKVSVPPPRALQMRRKGYKFSLLVVNKTVVNPVWNQSCVFDVDENTTNTKCVVVQVYDLDTVGNMKLIGECYISWENMSRGEERVCISHFNLPHT